MRFLLVFALAIGASLLSTGSASAQLGPIGPPNYGPGYRGNISPYLNILRGNNTGIDYFLGTRSEFQRRRDARDFREDLSNLRSLNQIPDEGLPGEDPIPTGTYSATNNTGGYFNNTYNFFPGGNRPVSSGIRPKPGNPAPKGRGGRTSGR